VSYKCEIANSKIWLTANPVIHEIPSTTIGLAVSQKLICYLQFNTCNWTGDQKSTV